MKSTQSRPLHPVVSRLIISILIGMAVALFYIFNFAPPTLLKHPVDYFFANLIIEGKKTFSTPIKSSDIYALLLPKKSIEDQMPHWYWVVGLFSGFSAASFGINMFFMHRRFQRKKDEKFHRGSLLLTTQKHNSLMQKTYKKSGPNSIGNCLFMGKEKLLVPEPLQYQHFAFLGASGYGKTTAIEDILLHARQSDQRCLVMDLGGSMYRKFGKEGDHILSLTHPQTESWDFWAETGIAKDAMAAALIEEKQGSHHFFTKAARALISALLETNSDLKGVLYDLENSNADLKTKLKGLQHTALKIIGEDAAEQTDGVIATVATETKFLRQLAANNAGKQPFSLSNWVRDPQSKSWVFLVVDEDAIELSKPLLRLWFDLACLSTLKRSPNDEKNDHLWFILDEVKSLGFLPSLPAILDKGRKYKSSVVLGFQSISQLHSIYGANDGASILQGLQNQFFFRIGEQKCAEYASSFLGNEDIEQTSFSSSIDINYGKERDSISHARTRRPVVIPEQLRNLPHLTAYAKLAHHHPVLLSFQPKAFNTLAETQTTGTLPASLPSKPEVKKLLPFQQKGRSI